MKHIQLFLTGILLVAAITLASCHDDDTSGGGTQSQSESREVTINLTLPESLPSSSKQNEGTYAITAKEENAIKSVDVFLFHPTTGVLVSAPVSCTKVEANGAVNKKKFTTKLLSGTYDIVLIANASDQVNAARTSMTVGTSTKINVLALFKKSTGVGVKWNAASSNNFEPIPMWGEMKNQQVDETTSLLNTKMVRMVAKVNIKNNAGTDVFWLSSVRVYGYNTEGFVAPVGDYTNNTVSSAKVSNPSLEGGRQAITARPAVAEDNELVYTVMTIEDVAIEEEIYLFEALKAQSSSEADLKKATCLVIGGSFGSDTRESFYRIDFVKKTSSGGVDSYTYLDILRNHKYIVNIDRIDGRGYPTPDEAFLARPSYVDMNIVTIDEGEYNDTQFNEPYYFSVSKNNFGFARGAYTASATDNILKIKTDYPKGWKATLHGDVNCTTTAPEWISLDKMSTTAASPATGDEVHIVLQQNNTGAARQAWIKLTCGSFEKRITVTQSDDMQLSITPESWFEFPSGIGTAQSLVGRERTFDVVWSPVASDIDIAVVKGSTATDMFSFDDRDGRDNITDSLQISGATYAGRKTYKILPTAITEAEITAAEGFPEKTSEIQYTLMDGTTKVTRIAYVKQVHYNVVAADMSKLYMGNNKTFTLHIRSNAKWKITDIKENLNMGTNLLGRKAGDNLAVYRNGGPNMLDGDALIFTTFNATATGQVVVKFESADTPKKFDDITIEIPIDTRSWFNGHSGWAGSNIYWDEKQLTFDDVGVTTHADYQGVYFLWGSLYGIGPGKTPYEEWKETTPIYTPSATVQNGGAWDSWPRIGNKVNLSDEYADPPAGMTDRNRAYLYDITNGNTGLGDICKYLTEKGWAPKGKWRMPTSQEFESKISYTGWITDDAIITTTMTDGTTRMPSGKYRTDYFPEIWFPASGNRFGNGPMRDVNGHIYYWTSSPLGTIAYSFSSNKYQLNTENGSSRGIGFPVRCVKE